MQGNNRCILKEHDSAEKLGCQEPLNFTWDDTKATTVLTV